MGQWERDGESLHQQFLDASTRWGELRSTLFVSQLNRRWDEDRPRLMDLILGGRIPHGLAAGDRLPEALAEYDSERGRLLLAWLCNVAGGERINPFGGAGGPDKFGTTGFDQGSAYWSAEESSGHTFILESVAYYSGDRDAWNKYRPIASAAGRWVASNPEAASRVVPSYLGPESIGENSYSPSSRSFGYSLNAEQPAGPPKPTVFSVPPAGLWMHAVHQAAAGRLSPLLSAEAGSLAYGQRVPADPAEFKNWQQHFAEPGSPLAEFPTPPPWHYSKIDGNLFGSAAAVVELLISGQDGDHLLSPSEFAGVAGCEVYVASKLKAKGVPLTLQNARAKRREADGRSKRGGRQESDSAVTAKLKAAEQVAKRPRHRP